MGQLFNAVALSDHFTLFSKIKKPTKLLITNEKHIQEIKEFKEYII